MPKYIQVFPIDRYPGMKCYVIMSTMRHLVLTENCNTIYVEAENITIGNYVMPRQTPGQSCNRCYLSDYLNVLSFILFGSPQNSIPSPAPKGALIIEDDVVLCKDTLDYLDECFDGQYNCLLGRGTWANFYAGATSEQKNPTNYSSKRFTTSDEIFAHKAMTWQTHVDLYLRKSDHHGLFVQSVNHVGGKVSVMNHTFKDDIRCNMSDSLAAEKFVFKRHKDVKIWYAKSNDAMGG